MLIAIVLVSIMNVMIMAVYERIREIGTIAAIGTLPGKILSMFVIEGFCLGIFGATDRHCSGALDRLCTPSREDHLQLRHADRTSTHTDRGVVRRAYGLTHCHHRSRAGEPPARIEGVENGADSGIKTCIGDL